MVGLLPLLIKPGAARRILSKMLDETSSRALRRRLLLRVAAMPTVLGAREREPQQPAADGNLLTMARWRCGSARDREAYAVARQGEHEDETPENVERRANRTPLIA
jgi:hypothetical protein